MQRIANKPAQNIKKGSGNQTEKCETWTSDIDALIRGSRKKKIIKKMAWKDGGKSKVTQR